MTNKDKIRCSIEEERERKVLDNNIQGSPLKVPLSLELKQRLGKPPPLFSGVMELVLHI